MKLLTLIIKQFTDKRMERFKGEVRKLDLLFQKEFDAASRFIALSYRLGPHSPHSEQTPHEPYEEFAENFGQVLTELEQYRENHAAALSRETLDRLDVVIDKVREGVVAMELERRQPSNGGMVPDHVLSLAGEVARDLREIRDELWQSVRLQDNT